MRWRIRRSRRRVSGQRSGGRDQGARLLKLKSRSNACLFNSILHGCFEYVDFYIPKCFEFNAVSGDACFAELLSKCLGKVLLVFNSHNVDGNAGCIRTYADLIKLLGLSIGIFNGVRAISDVWVGYGFSFLVFSIQEPQFTGWHQRENNLMQLLHFAPCWFRLSGDIGLDLLLRVQISLPWSGGSSPALREPSEWSRLARPRKPIHMISDSVDVLLAL